MPEQIGQFYPTQVPSYTEAADIRKAFNLYHYGTETVPTQESQILSSSIAGYIRDTLAAIDAAEIGQTVIGSLDAVTNLNDLTQSGVFKSTAVPTLALNYPTTQLGLLSYWQTSDNTFFQVYISLDGGYWWRTATQPQATRIWGTWSRASIEGHTHDTRYFTQSQINSRIDSSPVPSTAAVYDSAGKLVSLSTVTSTEVGRLAGVTGNIQDQINSKSDSTHTHDTRYYTITGTGAGKETARVFVRDPNTGNPTGAVAGDLWFW